MADMTVVDRHAELKEFFENAVTQEKLVAGIANVDAKAVAAEVLIACANEHKLYRCSNKSLFAEARLAAQSNLHIGGVLGQCYLVARKSRGVTDAKIQVGYKGYKELAYRSDRVLSLNMETVLEGDDFSFELGTEPKVSHVPKFAPGAMATHYYAVAQLLGGGVVAKVWSREQVEHHRDKYVKGLNSASPWLSAFDSMAKKTVMHDLMRMLPLQSDHLHLIEQTEYVEKGAPLPEDVLAEGDTVPAEDLEDLVKKAEETPEPPLPVIDVNDERDPVEVDGSPT